MTKPTQLRTPPEVRKIKLALLKEQKNKDALTGLPLEPSDAVLDHCHKSQYVRAVLHRQTNAALGRIENLYTRSLAWWYPLSLPEFLRQSADYIERQPDKRYLHPGWMKKLKIEFNKLNEAGKQSVLKELGLQQGSNSTERKKIFAGFLKKDACEFHRVLEIMERVNK